jgi:hypothetical protein
LEAWPNVKIIMKKGGILTFSESNRGEVRPEKSETAALFHFVT